MTRRVTGGRSAWLRVSATAATIGLTAGGFVVAEPAVPASASRAWSIAGSSNLGHDTNFLYAVSCAAVKSCMAAGFYTSPGVDRTLVESWNGTTWKIVPSPSPGGVWNFLYAISCVSTSSCTAVGRYENPSGVNRTLIESWNGTSWNLIPSPNRGSGANVLSAVSCVSSTSCIAVGSSQVGASTRTLVEIWNGRTWTVDASSANHAPSSNNSLAGVSCVSVRSCTAVGAYADTHGLMHTLTESWDGSRWSIGPSRDNGPDGSTLVGVSCVSPRSCQAVGTYGLAGFDTRAPSRTLVEAWNGSSWKIVPSPNREASSNVFSGVSCASTNSCTAVGWSVSDVRGFRHTLIESWNGSAWRIVSSPNRVPSPTTDNYLGVNGSGLNGVSCLSGNVCRSAGVYVDFFGHDQTLIESNA